MQGMGPGKMLDTRSNMPALRLITTCLASITLAAVGASNVAAQSPPLVGTAAFGDWRSDRPGVSRLIRPEDLPAPGATRSAATSARVVQRPAGASPQVPPGFKIELFADKLSGPRQIRVAPNGDIFVAETT